MPTDRKPMKSFKIFRPGKHTASCGTVVEFTEQQLLDAVKVYDPGLYATPLVIGHPKQEDRAYGWAASLSYSDGHLWVNPEHVEPQFAELVENKAFRNRSASWYMPDHPNNPSPGNLYPKHIGFLGAVPPALKGLGDIQFNEQASPVDFAEDPHPELLLEFADMTADDRWSMASALASVGRTLRTVKNFLIAEKGQEEADRILPEWEVEDPTRQSVRMEERARAEAESRSPSYTEPAGKTGPQVTTTDTTGDSTMTPAEIEAMKKENERLAARNREFSEREENIRKAESEAKLARINAALQPHVDAGRLLPAQRPQVAAFMATLDDSAQVVEFGEAAEGQQAPKLSPYAFMDAFLGKLPKAVDFKERSNANTGGKGTISQREYAEKITAKVNEAKANGVELSFAAASLQVAADFEVVAQDGTPNV